MVCFYPVRKDLIDAAEAAGGNWTNDYTLHVYNGPFYICLLYTSSWYVIMLLD